MDIGDLWELISTWVNKILAIPVRVLPDPLGTLVKYAIIIFIVVSLITFLMKLWNKLKPQPKIGEINKVRGKHAGKVRSDARSAERSGNLVQAAESYRALGKTKKALELYQQAGAMDRAGDLLVHEGRTAEAISIWESSGNYILAARHQAKNGEHDRAAVNFARANNYSQAAEMYEKAGNFEKAGEFYTKAGFHAKAASNYSKAGMTLPAAKAFENYFMEQLPSLRGISNPQREQSIKDLARRSGELYKKAGKMEQAAEIYIKGGFFAQAAQILEDLGEHDRAAKLYEEGGKHDQAARLLVGTDDSRAKALQAESLRSQGKIVEAAKLFQEAEDYSAAADMYAQAEMNVEAAEMLLKAGVYSDAASLFIRAGKNDRAAVAYESARDYESAVKIYRQLGDAEGAVRAMLKADMKIEAAQELMKMNRQTEAYQALQEVAPDDDSYREACYLMAKMHAQANRHEAAIQLLQRGIKGETVGPDTIELYYALARIFELRKDYPLAQDIYQKILAENIAFKDAANRHRALRDQLMHTAAAPPPQPGAQTMVVDQQGGARANQRYKIIEELGRGGMGVVYKAMDVALDRVVAYKILPPDLKNHPKIIESLNQEAKALAKLHHPNIVMVFDTGILSGEYFFAMEFVEGNNLKEIVREKGAMPLSEVVRISSQMAEALNYAHSRKLMHRDIKTSNVMLSNDGTVKLMDFGLAKALGEAAAGRTAVSGTPYYMSPEQTVGEGIDHRTDIYSLGIMMFELATGQVPFKEGNIGYHHMHTPLPSPRTLRPDLPEALEKIIVKCAQKKKEDRYQSAAQIVEDLKSVSA